ncbi:MAG: hypothetical protein LBP74_00920, partial [Treponema sp.]|nr:hypothetical protein [Treponema sp.]
MGNRIDINPPKITVASPKNGSYLHDLRTFNVVATDDMKVENVFVYSAMEENFDLAKAEWIGITPPGQDNPDIWTWQKNTQNEEDGIFKIIFRAVDNTGKTSETDELVYTIKNLPPRVDLNIPNFSLKDRRGLLPEEISLAKNGFSIDSGGVLIGYATDVQGVQYGSPKIKFWREGTPKPAEWSDVDVPDWTATDPNSGSKGREFRYYITDHTERDANGILIDPRIAAPLPVGDYNLQVHVADTGVDENGAEDPLSTIFPPPYKIDNIDYEHLIIHVVQSAESPRLDVTFTPDNVYQSESFVIEAKASHSKGIGEIDLLVRKSGDSAVHTLLWEADRENLYDVDINGAATKSRIVESSFIIPGGYYPEKGGGTFEFDSGTFEFTIQANSRAGARFSHTRTVYIDNTLPTVQITQVDPGVRVEPQRWNDPNYINLVGRDTDRPYFRQDYAHNIREGYIVNGRVAVNVASFDQNGLGIVEGSAPGVEVRRLRYILAKVQFSDASNDALVKTELESILPYDRNQPWDTGTNALNKDIMYNAADTSYWITGYLDELPAPSNPTVDPLITSPAADVITLNTPQAWPGTGELYLFITAKDKADNLASLMKDNTTIGYHFRVNQGSDKPYVKFTDIRPDIKTPEDLAGVYSNVMDLNARIRGSLEDDDGIITPTNTIPDPVNDSVQFWILRDGLGETERQLPLNAGLINQRGRSIAFEFNRLELGQAYRTTPSEVAEPLPDGVYRLIVKVSDAPSMKDNFASADNFTPGPGEHTWFAIDEKTPVITIKTPEKFTFVQSDFPMQVQAFDANGPLYLEIIPPRARASKNTAAHSALSFSGSPPYYTGDLPALAQNWDLNYLKWTTGVADTEWFNAASGNDTDPNKRLAKYGAQRYADIRGNAAAWDKIKAGGSDADGGTNLKRIIIQTALDVSASSSAPTFDGPKDFTPPAGIGTNSQWDFHLFGIDQDHLEARVIAKDRFLKRGEEILTVKIDEVPPVVEGQVGTQWFTGTSVITGSAWDPTRDDQDKIQHASPAVPGADGAVVSVRYWTAKMLSSGTWPAPPADMTVVSADPTKWQSAILSNQDAPVTPWNITIPVDAATDEGQYVLYLAAFDQSGKASVRTYANGTLNPGSDGLPVKASTTNMTWADSVNTVFLTYGIDKSPPKISGLQEPVSSPFTYPRPPAYDPADESTWTDANWTGDMVAAAYSDLRNAPFGLSGHINDSNGLETLVITQRKGVVGTEVEVFRKVDYSTPAITKQTNWSLGTLTDPLPKKDATTSYSAADWASHAVDGDYVYTITVTDVAGRTTTITRTVNVDTIAPTLTISSPHGSPSQHAYVSSSTLFFAGDASDVHPGPVYYWDGPAASTPVVPATKADADAAVTPSGTVGWKKATGTPSWRIETTIPAGDPEGERHIYIITFDTLGQRNTNITYSSENGTDYHTAADVFEFPYALDSSPPTLSEEMIATENQTLVAASFNLAGLVGDANGVRSLTITQRLQGSPNSDPHNFDYQMYNIWDSSIDDFYADGSYYLNGVLLPGASNPGENNPLKGLGYSWDTSRSFLKVDASGVPTGTSVSMPGLPLIWNGTAYVHDNISGEFDYIITAVDIFGRTTTQVRNVRVDVRPPEISFRAPPINKAENSWFDRTSVIRGDGTDDLTGISRVLYWIGKGTLSGTNYTPPVPPSYATLSDIENRVDYIPGTNDLYWEGVSGTSQWQVSLDIDSGLAEGYYTLYVIAIDGAGNITPQPSSTTIIDATAIVAGRTYTIESTGTTNWASFGVTGAAVGTRFTASSNGTTSSGTGTVRPYYALAYNFRVDKANPTITETKIHPEVDVVYNPSPENYSPLRKALFDLELVLHDSHGLARLDIKQTKDNNPSDPLSISFTGITTGITGTDVTRTLSQLPWTSLNTSVGGVPPDGVYDYEFTLWDATISDSNPANHKSAKITRRIIVDNTKPTVTHITEPGELYQTMNSNMIIRGNATDPAPGTIRKVLYWAGEATDTTGTGTGTYTVPSEVPAYNPADPIYDPNNVNYASRPWKEADYSSSGWSKEIPLGSAAEGQQVVAVRTEDKHGNISDLKLYQSTNTNNVSLRFFYKDYAAPTFLETEIATETKVSKPPQFSMSGYVQDSNSVDKIVLTQHKMNGLVITETKTFILHLNKTSTGKNLMQYWKFDGLPYLDNTGDTQTSYTSGSDGLSNTSPITFTGKPFTGSGDFKYVITAYDVSPRTAVQNRSVTIDTNPPAVTFSPGSGGNPAAGTWLNQTTILAGTASDPTTPSSGVNAVYYAVTADSDSHPALYTSPGVFNSAQWEAATARGGFQSWNITLPITAASGNIAEGKYKLHIIAMDGAGNIGGTGLDTPVTYLFNVDTAFPAITAKYNNSEADAFYSPASPGSRFTLTGEFGDSYGIDSIQITQTYDGVTKLIKEYTDGAAYNNSYNQGSAVWPTLSTWSLGSLPRDPAASDIKAPTAANITDGVYTYRITVKDTAGKETTAVRIMSVDSSDPTVTVTSPQMVVDQGWTGDANITITGTATDDPDGTGPIPSGIIANVYYWLADASTVVNTLVTDANGGITGGAIWAEAQLISGTDNWSTGSYAFPFPEGKLKLIVQARDSANHFSAQVVKEFWVDQTDPSLTAFARTASTAANITGPTTEAFKLSGNAWDTNGIRNITIVQRKAGVTNPLEVEVVPVTGVAYTGNTGTSAGDPKGWSFDAGMANLPRLQTDAGKFTHSLDDGTYTYIVTLTDNSGRTTKTTLEINVDRTRPNATGTSDITVTYPVVPQVGVPATWVRGTAVSITGKAADSMPAVYTGTITPSGIDKIIYWAGANSATPPSVGNN